MTTAYKETRRIDRVARLKWVPIRMMRVHPEAQRRFNQPRADYLVANFDLDQIGILVVSNRDGWFWIIDGQHRKAALEAIGYGDQQVQCDVYEGLTEEDEAEMFLRRNDQLGMTQYTKFKVSVKAGRAEENAINNIVRKCGMQVSNGKTSGSIAAVSTLRTIYTRYGPDILTRTLCVCRDAYGQSGLEAPILHGIAMVLHRYSELKDRNATDKLANAFGGINGLTNKAAVLGRALGQPKAQCIAAAAVDVINSGKGSKFPKWFSAENGDE